jgi:hypothetical protein
MPYIYGIYISGSMISNIPAINGYLISGGYLEKFRLEKNTESYIINREPKISASYTPYKYDICIETSGNILCEIK